MIDSTFPTGLRRFAKLLVAVTLLLIFAGSMVTSTGSALAVPDWPLAYGMLFPPMIGGVFYEHGHRLIAATVGFLTLAFSVFAGLSDAVRWRKRLAFAALGLVVMQGLLGGLTVLLRLPLVVSVSHAVLAQTFFCVIIILAYAFSKERDGRVAGREDAATEMARSAKILVGAVFIQLILGALMRHLNAGLAVYDFPLMAGSWWPSLSADTLTRLNAFHLANDYPPVTAGMVLAHLLHRFGALIVAAVVVVVNVRLARSGVESIRITRNVFYLDLILSAQVVLGIWSVWSGRHPLVASLHVMTGAALLGLSVLLALRSHPVATALRSPEECLGAASIAPPVVARRFGVFIP